MYRWARCCGGFDRTRDSRQPPGGRLTIGLWLGKWHVQKLICGINAKMIAVCIRSVYQIIKTIITVGLFFG